MRKIRLGVIQGDGQIFDVAGVNSVEVTTDMGLRLSVQFDHDRVAHNMDTFTSEKFLNDLLEEGSIRGIVIQTEQ